MIRISGVTSRWRRPILIQMRQLLDNNDDYWINLDEEFANGETVDDFLRLLLQDSFPNGECIVCRAHFQELKTGFTMKKGESVL